MLASLSSAGFLCQPLRHQHFRRGAHRRQRSARKPDRHPRERLWRLAQRRRPEAERQAEAHRPLEEFDRFDREAVGVHLCIRSAVDVALREEVRADRLREGEARTRQASSDINRMVCQRQPSIWTHTNGRSTVIRRKSIAA